MLYTGAFLKRLKMKQIFTLFALCFSLLLSAQKKDKAELLLDEVHTKIKSFQNISLDFKYALDNPKEQVKQDTQGKITLEGDKYLLHFMGVTKLFDGKKIYTIIPDNEEVTIENAEQKEDGNIAPNQILSFYKKGYKYKWDIEQKVKGKKIQYIELKPNKKTDIKQILLGIDMQTKLIYNLIQVGKNDSKTTLTVENFKTNQKLPTTTFLFDEQKYKKEGYQISKF